MKILVNICLFFIALSAILGCSQSVCPAFQSYFILDENTRDKQFTYFGEDSMPRNDMYAINRNQFGIIEDPVVTKIPPPIRNPFAKLNTIEAEVIYPEKVDSLEFQGDEIMLAEMDVVDSASLEAGEEEGKIWHFNIEQEEYFNYIKKKVGLSMAENDSLAGMVEESALPQDSISTKPKKKGLGGFFNKFKKKKNVDESNENIDEDSNDNESNN